MNEELKQIAFRETFNTKVGRQVLAVMLVEMDFFNSEKSTPEEVARSNYAAKILRYLGINKKGNELNMANAIMELPYEGEKE